jgi:hypothetical protein
MPAPAASGLQAQLDQISAQVPAPVMGRVTAATTEIEASGTAPGLAVGDTAPGFERMLVQGRAQLARTGPTARILPD